jgi:hypothetical protein
MWIVHTILFAVFAARYFREHSLQEQKRVRSTASALFINILVVTVASRVRRC